MEVYVVLEEDRGFGTSVVGVYHNRENAERIATTNYSSVGCRRGIAVMIIEEKDIIDQNDEPLIYTVADLADAVAEAIAKEREACARLVQGTWVSGRTIVVKAIRARGDA